MISINITSRSKEDSAIFLLLELAPSLPPPASFYGQCLYPPQSEKKVKKYCNRGWGGGDKFNGREKIEWKSTNKLKMYLYFVFLS
jgi:hypothetical protein